MSIVSCPRCRDEVTVPAKARPSAMVRCPLCREQYRLDEALEQLPPALILVDGGYDDDEGELVGAGVGAGEYQVAGEYGGSSGFDRGGASDSVFSTGGPGGTALADSAVAAPTPRITGAPRPKRKEKSAVAEIIKVVLGGVVGLTAGMLLLWWAFGRDPLQIGPSVAQYAPWIVPAQFHGKGAPKPDSKTTADTSGGGTSIAANTNQNPPVTPAPGAGGFSQPGVDLEAAANSFNAADPANPNAPAVSPQPGADPAGLTIDSPLPGIGDDPAMEKGNSDPLSALDTPPDLSPAIDTPPSLPDLDPLASDLPPASPDTPPMPPSPATDAATTPSAPDPFAPPTTATPDPFAPPAPGAPDPFAPPASPAPSDDPLAPADEPASPEVAPAQVVSAVSEAKAAREAFDDSKGKLSPPERQQLATEMYARAAELGPLLAAAPTDNADFAATIEQATAELTALADRSKHNAIGFLTAKRLDTPDEGPGILLVGTVKDFKSVGSLYETTVEMAGRDPRVIFVVTADNPQDQYKVGDQVAIAGRIVRDVKKDLPKYGGEQTLVVEQGHAVVLPAQ